MWFSPRSGRPLAAAVLLSLAASAGGSKVPASGDTGLLQLAVNLQTADGVTIQRDAGPAPAAAAEPQAPADKQMGSEAPARTVLEIDILNASDVAILQPGSSSRPQEAAPTVWINSADAVPGGGWSEDRFYLKFAIFAEFVLLLVVIGIVVSITGSSREKEAEKKNSVKRERLYLVGDAKNGYFWKPFKVGDTGRL